MSHDNDHDLLEEIKYDRNQTNNSSSKGSLISLFENDKSAVFTPSSATGLLFTLFGAIVVGTLWWAGINNRMDTLETQQEVWIEAIEQTRNKHINDLKVLQERLGLLRDDLRTLSNRYDSDTKLFQTRIERDIINLTSAINDLTKDTNDLNKMNNEMEKKVREIEFDIERLREKLQMSHRP